MLDFVALTISGDEDGYCLALDAELASVDAYLACPPGKTVTVTVEGVAYLFLVEKRSRDRVCGSVSYRISGRSGTIALEAPRAAPVTRTWGATSAQGAALELCAACGVTLSWRTVDWPLPSGRLVAEAESPISIITRLAAACGAVVQSTPGGVLVVRPRYPVSPTCYADALAADVAQLSEAQHIFQVSEEYVAGDAANAVRVTDLAADDEEQIVLEADADRNASSTPAPGETFFLRVYARTTYDLRATSGTLALLEAGVEADIAEETVAFPLEDQASLSSMCAELMDVDWFGADGGEVAAMGFATLALADGAALAVGRAEYRTRYDLWQFIPADLGEDFPVLFLAETTGEAEDAGAAVLVSRGAGDRPAADEIVDELVVSESAAVELGRNWLDAQYPVMRVELDALPDEPLLPGDLVEVDDAELGDIWRGKLIAVELAVSADEAGAVSLSWRGTVERSLIDG